MTEQEIRTLHALYVAVHRAHWDVPEVWTDHECNRVLTAIMAAKSFSWRVVGITPTALKQFSELAFRYRSKQGFTRAYISPRVGTVRKLLENKEPVDENVFIKTWVDNDLTVSVQEEKTKPRCLSLFQSKTTMEHCSRVLEG